MLISDIGEIVSAYQHINRLDALIEAAKSGKINVQVQGQGMGEEMLEAVQSDVIACLRQQRNDYVRTLSRWGFTE
jgi:hypothetical protein